MDNINKNVQKIKPNGLFCNYIFKAIPLAFDESMSYYECLCGLLAYLKNTVMPAINNNADALIEVQAKITELQEYVDNYFKNLDVQDEINNKLDQMAEDGTLDLIVERYILNNIQTGLNFRKIQEYNSSLTDLYEGYPHYYLQGFCKTGENKILMGLINTNHVDNIAKLVEYNLQTGVEIRHAYIDGNHCNSITFNPNNNKLYIASNSKNVEGVELDCNDLIVVDYSTLRVEDVIQLSNLYSERLRSVFYDEDEDKLYGGNFHTIYEIDVENETIGNVLELDTTYVQPDMTYQVLKKYKNYFVGVQVESIIFWNSDGSLYKQINIDRTTQNILFGEPEDFILDNNGNLIVGAIKRENEYTNYYSVLFYYTNIYINTTNILRPSVGGDETNYIMLFCDNTATNVYEDGTQNYPFKTLQKAINFASNSSRTCRINIKGTNYPTTMIRGVNNIRLLPAVDNITINGLNIVDSNVIIVNNNHILNINGIRSTYSKIVISANTANQIYINKLNVDSIASHNCIGGRDTQLTIENCNLVGDNIDNLISFEYNANVIISNCIFSNYTGYKAIVLNRSSNGIIRGCTFNTSSSSDQHIIELKNHSILNTQESLNSVNDYDKDGSSKVYGTKISQTITPAFYGDVTDVNMNYDCISVTTYTPGYTTAYNVIDMKLKNDFSYRAIANNFWPGSTTLKSGTALLKINNNKLQIEVNRRLNIASDGTFTYENITSNNPDSPSETLCVTAIEYYDI